MTRILLILALLLAGAVPAFAQSDLTLGQMNIPGTNTSGWRVHANSSTVNATIQGNVIAAGGYKQTLLFSHGGQIVLNSSNTLVPIAGTADTRRATTGVNVVRTPTAGSIIGVTIASSTALTNQAAHAEAVVLDNTGSLVTASGLTAVIGNGLTNTTTATATRARGISNFGTAQGVGCRITTDAGVAPATASLLCTVIIEY